MCTSGSRLLLSASRAAQKIARTAAIFAMALGEGRQGELGRKVTCHTSVTKNLVYIPAKSPARLHHATEERRARIYLRGKVQTSTRLGGAVGATRTVTPITTRSASGFLPSPQLVPLLGSHPSLPTTQCVYVY